MVMTVSMLRLIPKMMIMRMEVLLFYEGRCGQTGGTQRMQQRGSLLLAAVRQDLEARPAKNQWPEHHSAGGHEPVEELRRRSAPPPRKDPRLKRKFH